MSVDFTQNTSSEGRRTGKHPENSLIFMICPEKAAPEAIVCWGKFLKVVEKSQNSMVRKGFGIFIITFKDFPLFQKILFVPLQHTPHKFSN